MEKLQKAVQDAHDALKAAVAAARAGGYRVSFQTSGADPYVVVDGGPEPPAAAPAQPAESHEDESDR